MEKSIRSIEALQQRTNIYETVAVTHTPFDSNEVIDRKCSTKHAMVLVFEALSRDMIEWNSTCGTAYRVPLVYSLPNGALAVTFLPLSCLTPHN